MRYSTPDTVDIPRSFEWRGRRCRFNDELWKKITGSVNAPITNEIVTLMRHSKTHIDVIKMIQKAFK